MLSVLERVTSCAVIIAAIVFVGRSGTSWYKARTAASIRGEYKVGDVVKDTTALALNAAPQTLILVTASTCHFCTANMEFFQSTVAYARASGLGRKGSRRHA